MPLAVDKGRRDLADKFSTPNCVTIGLVNNMPDAALEATERQFVSLIEAAAANAVVNLKLFSIPSVPRGVQARLKLAEEYRDISKLADAALDGLIVTGTEPRALSLKDEPYWSALTAVIDWARDNTASTVWSCLAAHAAVLHIDGVERRALAAKRFGVFDCAPAAAHPMTMGGAPRLCIPHSRYNDLPERALTSCGYKILNRSAAAGVDSFVKLDRSLFLYFQGHPEYETQTLLREYRRDIVRYLKDEREQYPATPQGYFSKEATKIVEAFRAQALSDHRPDLIADFPIGSLEAGIENTWRRSAIGVYERWIGYLLGRKAERRPLRVPLRRTWRDWPLRDGGPAAEGSAG